jgi:glucose-1-phosphate adenylyltransferase
MLNDTLAIILAGGQGSRLEPLTRHRAKPAVPFGGKYRIIDFALANCLHSGLRRVLVLTQYKSHSLQKHLRDGWSIFNPELGEYITPIPPQMRAGERWYSGTANAVYQNRYLLERSGAELTLILSGDHIYRMDYAALIDFHRTSQADVTLACMDVPLVQAGELDGVSLDPDLRVTGFVEQADVPMPMAEDPSQVCASIGIYLFRTQLLLETLVADEARPDSSHDLGRDIVPGLLGEHRVHGYRFGGTAGRVTLDRYWRDVRTLDGYYEANMDLLEPVPLLNLYQGDWPIRTYEGQHPPARTAPGASNNEGIFINSIAASGVVIAGGLVQHSILGFNTYVGDEAVVEDSLLLGNVQVGDNARLRRCIVDKHVIIPPGEHLGYDLERDRERFVVTEKGVVVVPRGYRFG